MATMKKGTNVGLDKNYKNVCVGDQIKDADGYIYVIDKYGNAVQKGSGVVFRLHEIHPFELYQTEPAPIEVKDTPDTPPEPEPVEELQEEPAPTTEDPIAKATEWLTDQDLADELRRRGYEVKATKTTIVEL